MARLVLLPALGSSQFLRNFHQVAALKQPYRCDAGGACCEAGAGILQGDAADGQHRHAAEAGCVQGIRTGAQRSANFFEDRSEDGEICTLGFGEANFFGSMAGHRHNCVSRFTLHVSRKSG